MWTSLPPTEFSRAIVYAHSLPIIRSVIGLWLTCTGYRYALLIASLSGRALDCSLTKLQVYLIKIITGWDVSPTLDMGC